MHTTSAAPSPPGPVDPAAIRPRRSMFLVALGLAVVGLVVGVVVIAVAVRHHDLAVVPVNAGKVHVSTRDRTLYSTVSPDRMAVSRCRFTGPGTVTVASALRSSITSNGTVWYSVATLHATAVGTYSVSCPGTRGRLAVAGDIDTLAGVLGRVVLGAVIVVAGLLAGAILGVVVGVRRASHRNRLQPPGGPTPGAAAR